ncbi:MAG: ParB family transcriptional regulator, chromosome partitioning protein [Thermoleophilaceae bacterium]|jgi:ParB family chromosome partitioning protein|nr:ParB family transcriptional regulator, chromosome partitioning protein [Thermoleophilaceae bacterium]
MSEDRRGMGRGLAAILPRPGDEDGLREIPVELIDPNPRQPRRTFDETKLIELADSIRTRGVLQPIVVRPLAGGRYELVAGERRLRASRIAELELIPAMLRQADDWERLDLALAENMARQNLNAVEEARACAMLVDDLGLTKEEVGRRVGRSRVAISNLIRLLDLPEEVLELIEAGSLSEGHGRAILVCKDHTARRRLARSARDGGWSVRETERRAREAESGDAEPRRPRVVHPDLAEALAAAEDTLAAALGREVRARAKGDRCVVEIEFDEPSEAIELARSMLAAGVRRVVRERRAAATIGVRPATEAGVAGD